LKTARFSDTARLDLTQNAAITAEVADKLKQTLPQCKISHDKPRR
jgi:hypothetical protein